MKQSKIFIPVVFLFVYMSNVCTQDRPQFLGPERNNAKIANVISMWQVLQKPAITNEYIFLYK